MREATFRTVFTGAILAAGLAGWCAVPVPYRFPPEVALSQREQRLHRVSMHVSEFATSSEPLALPPCSDTRPPEALATPDPLLQIEDMRVRVSFIVGSDGRVHSPFVLESGGTEEDRLVLHAIRRWRYRPALCNGVPTEVEARVRFTSP
jgi:TonB family protein